MAAETQTQAQQHTNSSIENNTQESTNPVDDFNAQSTTQKLRILFSNKHYKRILPFIMIWVTTGYMPAVFFAAWGAEQFSGCNAQNAEDEESADCDFEYSEYYKAQSMFISLGGAMSFIFGGLIGRISDSFGRKPLLYLNIILAAGLYCPLIIFPNIWLALAMLIPAGLNSSDNSFTPTMIAYLSDILPESQRTMGYAVAYAFSAIGLVFGVGAAVVLGM